MCKRCSAKIVRELDSIEAHEAECRRKIDNGIGPAIWTMEEQKDSPMRSREDVVNLTGVNLKQTLSETIVEYPNVELCPRLAKEGRELFAHVIAASTDTDQLDRLGRVASRHGVRKQPEASNVIIGWQRYSVDFGKGRMGLEFEYDTREIRRLVVTCVTKEASALGVCARDILIGIGNRIVPRATDPLAVHRHLIECIRPVSLHFFRPHVLGEANNTAAPLLQCNGQRPKFSSREEAVTMATSLLLGRFLSHAGSNESSADSDAPTQTLFPTLKLGSGALLCRSPSEFIIPALRMDPARYGVDDEGRSIHAEARCLLNEGARLVLVRALKPLLRPKPWELIYDSACDGMCLSALYANAGAAKSSQAQLIVCRDDHGHVAGAFLDEPIRNVNVLSSLLLERADRRRPRLTSCLIRTWPSTVGWARLNLFPQALLPRRVEI